MAVHWLLFKCYSVVAEPLWLVSSQVEDSTARDFFHRINSTENGSPPPLTTQNRELVSVLKVTVEPGIEPETSEYAVRHYTQGIEPSKVVYIRYSTQSVETNKVWLLDLDLTIDRDY